MSRTKIQQFEEDVLREFDEKFNHPDDFYRDVKHLILQSLQKQRQMIVEEALIWAVNNYTLFSEDIWIGYRGEKTFGELFREEYQKSILKH